MEEKITKNTEINSVTSFQIYHLRFVKKSMNVADEL